LVTGGTGFLGAHVVRELVARGESVRVLTRGAGDFPGSVDKLIGDVVQDLDGTAPLARAMDGCERVYHLAGFVSRDPDDGQRMMRVHIDGTRRVLQAARDAGVRRVVLASTSGTMAVSRTPEPILDERAPYATELVSGWPYYLSKIYQEKLALDLTAAPGLELVVVNPSLLIGPGDERSSSTGDVRRFLRGQIPLVPPGGLCFVDVRDAAAATVAAMERGRAGERYLLGGPNWTFAEFFGRLERASKVRGPRLRLPDRLTLGAASLFEHAYKALGKQAPVDRVSVEMSQVFWYCDASKAARELGFVARDPGETLDDTIRDLRARMI
jgi:dihydroflavonol-4-reductase